MPRKRKPLEPGEGLHLSVRLDPGTAADIDRVIEQLSKSTGLSVSRTDVVRLLLREAINARAKHRK